MHSDPRAKFTYQKRRGVLRWSIRVGHSPEESLITSCYLVIIEVHIQRDKRASRNSRLQESCVASYLA